MKTKPTQLTRRQTLKLCGAGVASAVVVPGRGLAAGSRVSRGLKEKCQEAAKVLAGYLRELVSAAKVRENGCPPLLMPSVSSVYRAVWPDDTLNPLIALPSLANKEELAQVLAFLTESVQDLQYLPDRVEPDGLPILFPGHAPADPFDPGDWSKLPPMTDRMPLHLPGAWVRLLDYYQSFGVEIPHKDRWAKLVARSVDCVSFACGLVYANPQNPPIGFGYQDSIRMSGWQLLSSLALSRGLQRATVLFAGAIGPARLEHWARLANGIRTNLYRLYDPKIGGFVGGSRIGHQFDVWGNGLAYGLAEPSQKQSIARFYRDHRHQIFLRGCTRQITEPDGWQGGANPGTYQNGGFWGTGTGYVLPVLAEQDPSLAIELLDALVANAAKVDFAEWLDAEGKPQGARKFLGTVALPLMGINSILENKPLIEYF